MLHRKLKKCSLITAGDNSQLRELLHPDQEYDFSGRYSLAHAVVPAGQATLKHRLESSEVYYVLSGRGCIHIDDERAMIEAGDAIEIPPGALQWVENTQEDDLIFLCIVDPAWRSADEEIVE